MSIASKHAYRFIYLRSDKWDAVRLEALVREKAECQICGEESIHNDAHHAIYPENVWDTEVDDLIVLCRPCHTLVHRLIELSLFPSKSKDRKTSIRKIQELITVLSEWRQQKGVTLVKRGAARPVSLLRRLDKVKEVRPWCAVCLANNGAVAPVNVLGRYQDKRMLWPLCGHCAARVETELAWPPTSRAGLIMAREWLDGIRKQRQAN